MLKTVILAAGKGTRMKSDLPKVLHEVCAKSMVEHVIDAARAAGSDDICVIVGYGADEVKEKLKDSVKYAVQEEQLGTGHAVKCAADFIGNDGDTMILCGDTPLIDAKTLKGMYEFHKSKGHKATLLSTKFEDPTGYGRIIRDADGHFIKNVEHKDATDEERESKEVNAGMYVFDSEALQEALKELKNDNVQGEYYLPDVLEIIKGRGGDVEAFVAERPEVIMGCNTVEQLREAERIMLNR
ncbi:MAG: NTP transferase domain-containing protein [Lachnospiraceae bacterium]|nr:NTP transferase domain-containing protein [Lachnospiraceae bacterium]